MKPPEISTNSLLNLLQDLIRIESVNPSLSDSGSGELKIARFIAEHLADGGLEVNLHNLGNQRANVVGHLKGRGEGPVLLLNGHMDTVGSVGMTDKPFRPDFKQGRVYGRGALDMKGGLAAMIAAVLAVAESNWQLKGDVLLTCVADEEYISLGTEALVNDYHADAAVVCEPTDLQIVIAHKGYAWARVDVFGRRAHGSRPDLGIDAIAKAGRILTELERLETALASGKRHPLLGFPSAHASLIKGGLEISSYPDRCRIEVERRLLPNENAQTFSSELEEIINRIQASDPDFRAQHEVFFSRPALEVSPNQPVIRSLRNACRQVIGKEPETAGAGGWLDSALLAAAGIPSVIFGPSGKGMHAAEEYVDFDSVVTTAQVLVRTILDFCGADKEKESQL